MKKNNSNGFVLAETLIVTVFLMVIFSMIYSNFYPIIGEYEKRETYDDVDAKYAVYWLKKLIEDSSYSAKNSTFSFNNYGFVRFKCNDMSEPAKQEMCKKIVKSLEVSGCDANGNYCDIFITKYQIGKTTNSFKDKVKDRPKRYAENCSSNESTCKNNYITTYKNSFPSKGDAYYNQIAKKNIFDSGLEEYIASLPDYTNNPNNVKYRVIASFHHKKDNNNYYSYSTIEVSRE